MEMIADIRIPELTGKDLFYYYLHDFPDKEYRSVVRLLPFATMDINRAYQILEYCEKEHKKLVAVYYGDKTDTKNMEYVGTIHDGSLYIGTNNF